MSLRYDTIRYDKIRKPNHVDVLDTRCLEMRLRRKANREREGKGGKAAEVTQRVYLRCLEKFQHLIGMWVQVFQLFSSNLFDIQSRLQIVHFIMGCLNSLFMKGIIVLRKSVLSKMIYFQERPRKWYSLNFMYIYLFFLCLIWTVNYFIRYSGISFGNFGQFSCAVHLNTL